MNFSAQAVEHLSQADPIMARLIQAVPEDQHFKPRGNAYETLIRSVVGQQISTKAADSVWHKLNTATELSPHKICLMNVEDLRACGLSAQKVKYIKGISEAFESGTIHENKWETWEDADIIKDLTQLPGIGVWTAQMFLMFYLRRLDVLPIGDLGLVKAFEKHYGKDRSELEDFAEIWRPFRSVATWTLWKSTQ